jgi:hypothetical protein
MTRALRLACLAAAFVIAASSGAAAAGAWHRLNSVRVTVSNSSLPPPGGKPHTTSFTPGHGLKKAQAGLNGYGIKRLGTPVPNQGCTGGYDAQITIVKHGGAKLTLHAYRCGGKTYGRTGGNVPGFLKALGITPP